MTDSPYHLIKHKKQKHEIVKCSELIISVSVVCPIFISYSYLLRSLSLSLSLSLSVSIYFVSEF